MRRLNSYSWADDNNGLHLDVPKMLEHMGLQDTEENREAVTRIALQYFNREFSGIPIAVVSER